jgi:hypothetical protein
MSQTSNRKCIGKKSNGEPCSRWAVKGATVCPSHGGSAPQVRKRAAVRAELESWGLGDTTVDPGETLLRLLSQAAARADRYAAAIQRLVDEQGLEAALVGDTYVIDDSGESRKVGEYIRGLAQLENQERDRAANFAKLAIQAGLAERQVRLAERQTSIVEKALMATLDDLGLSDEQQQKAFGRLAHHLRLIS